MRYFIRFITFSQLLLTMSASAQQWEPFSIPNDPKMSIGLLRTLNQNVYVAAFDGLYRSKDEGIHWQQIRQYTAQDGYRFFELNRQNSRMYYTQGLKAI
jgi:hypothetical protein